MNLQLLSLTFLVALLLAATVSDVRRRRIPNALVLYGMLLGLAFQTFTATGSGLLEDGGLGPWTALMGGLTGLALFLPLYALRMMAAGDVKLLAMVGVWLGTASVLYAALWSLLAGGVLAVAAMAGGASTRRVCRNLLALCSNAARHALGPNAQAAVSVTGRMPYGLAIAAGTSVEMARLLHAF
jgi:prepilin peptidase CpaA